MNTTMRITTIITTSFVSVGLFLTSVNVQAKPVGITAELSSITVKHKGKEVKIERDQDNDATVQADFALVARPCPPFCIQPMRVAEGVETIGEIEVIQYAEKISQGDSSLLLVDSRTPDWVKKGTIPSAVNIPWTHLITSKGATVEGIIKLMTTTLGAKQKEGTDEFDVSEAFADGEVEKVLDYTTAKTLILFCNGMWCGQSPASIRALLKLGYPAGKIKYYRGGMQSWAILGLSTVK